MVEIRRQRLTKEKWTNLYNETTSYAAFPSATGLIYVAFNTAFDTGSSGSLVGKLGRYSLGERVEN